MNPEDLLKIKDEALKDLKKLFELSRYNLAVIIFAATSLICLANIHPYCAIMAAISSAVCVWICLNDISKHENENNVIDDDKEE